MQSLNGAFYDCSSLKTVYYKGIAEEWDGIDIGDDNSDLTSATRYYYSETLPVEVNFWHYVDGVPKVWSCVGLEYTSNGDGTCYVKGIGRCTDTELVIYPVSPDGDSVTSIGDEAFMYCTSFTSVTIPDSVTSIGEWAFSNCFILASVIIGGGVKSIGYYAFNFCTSLTHITIPTSVTTIGEGAFCYCSRLTDVYYKGSEAQWKEIAINSSNEYLTNATMHYNS